MYQSIQELLENSVQVDEEKDGDEGCCVQLVSFREAGSPVSLFAQCCSNLALSVVEWSVVKSVVSSKK